MNKKITSLDNKEIKDLIKLSNKSKIRRESGFFVIEGQRELEMAINNGYEIDKIFYNENIIDINQIDFNPNTKIIAVNNDVYSKISFRNSTEGIVGITRIKKNSKIEINEKKINLVLILDGIEKPGNIGAILRSCDASNVDLVILTNEK